MGVGLKIGASPGVGLKIGASPVGNVGRGLIGKGIVNGCSVVRASECDSILPLVLGKLMLGSGVVSCVRF